MIAFPTLLRDRLFQIPPDHHAAALKFAEAYANWRQAGLERRVRELEGELAQAAKPTRRKVRR